MVGQKEKNIKTFSVHVRKSEITADKWFRNYAPHRLLGEYHKQYSFLMSLT